MTTIMPFFQKYRHFLVTCMLILAINDISVAKFVPRVTQKLEANGAATILINNLPVMRLMTANGNLSPRERAAIAADRLAVVIQKGLDPNTLVCKVIGESARLMAGETMIAIATPAEAKANGIPPAQLVKAWIRGIKAALAIPPLSASPNEVRIPVGESRTVTVTCLLDSPVSVQVGDAAIVKAESPKPGVLVLTGLSVGDTDVRIQCEDFIAIVKVHVRKYAGALAGELTGAVTGYAVPASIVRRAAEAAARSKIRLEPGAILRSVEVGQVPKNISPGSKAAIGVCIEVAGGDYIPARINTQAVIENRTLGQSRTSILMYSNDPERILRYQVLFNGRICPSYDGVRLLYHHQNMMGQRIGFVVDVINASNAPATLHVIEGIADPMADPVIAGYRAGVEFLENFQQCAGRIIDIPAGCRYVLVNQSMEHGYTASGILELRQLYGDNLIIRVLAKPENPSVQEDPVDTPLALPNLDVAKIRFSEHIYPNPTQKLEVKYSVGKQWVFLRLGKDAIKHAEQDRWLYGNYGVIYDINAVLENPLPTPQTVEFAFEATAGPASGIFLVENKLIPIKLATPPHEITVERVTIPRNSTKTVSIRTMPLSGSAYPATLIIRSSSNTVSSGG